MQRAPSASCLSSFKRCATREAGLGYATAALPQRSRLCLLRWGPVS
ncbi:hypothetical protein XOC_2447 [Xanthomonas oryzae pv. oryzicola BLS256]|uniref:Uncharacterized protein n=1 Tax=Xanthomonas oryzae pv. oryzicola (strain BLS256) TaxID=383407 RepID=G7TG23_XANOB|nr:hypothetical protein XOC_2447 [Xanthomonas oryzae pv. oryzicola BLS256]QEO97421.1 hypothetical protein XOCgx_2431 [Xanthomonas oryzae pv. oryzicola]